MNVSHVPWSRSLRWGRARLIGPFEQVLRGLFLALVVWTLATGPAYAQLNFSDAQVITDQADEARSVFAADLDGDGDADILSAAGRDNTIAWYENLEMDFGEVQVITTDARGAVAVYAADLDGDGDTDVLSASIDDDKIAWYENEGGVFGDQQVINVADPDDNSDNSTNGDADGAFSIYAIDLDSDDDLDVLSASSRDDKIAWYENTDSGFGDQRVINEADPDGDPENETNGNADRPLSVYAADLDGDGDPDVLSASYNDGKIAWYENEDGTFADQQVITTDAAGAQGVFAIDLDGDDDVDVLSASWNDDKVAWYENTGSEFGEQQVLSSDIDAPVAVYAIDLDLDGDVDVLSASFNDDTIAWYENTTDGFTTEQVISTEADGAESVFAADLDGDADPDVLSASWRDDTIAWYQNNPTADPITAAPAIPTRVRLEGNYPNPFNPATRIQYSLPQRQRVRLRVYDRLGHEVATVVDRVQSAGVYHVPFHAGGLPSGAYFYRLETSTFTKTNSMILLR